MSNFLFVWFHSFSAEIQNTFGLRHLSSFNFQKTLFYFQYDCISKNNQFDIDGVLKQRFTYINETNERLQEEIKSLMIVLSKNTAQLKQFFHSKDSLMNQLIILEEKVSGILNFFLEILTFSMDWCTFCDRTWTITF